MCYIHVAAYSTLPVGIWCFAPLYFLYCTIFYATSQHTPGAWISFLINTFGTQHRMRLVNVWRSIVDIQQLLRVDVLSKPQPFFVEALPPSLLLTVAAAAAAAAAHRFCCCSRLLLTVSAAAAAAHRFCCCSRLL